MIYAINKQTKEHRVVSPNDENWDEEWRCAHADADGWIPWDGGECPLPAGWKVEIKTSSGHMQTCRQAGRQYWGRHGRPGDIIAYRPILDADNQVYMNGQPVWQDAEGTIPVTKSGQPVGRVGEPEAPEWDGEGLPPAGIRCEALRSHGWVEVYVVGYCEDGYCVFDTGSEFKGNKDPNKFRPIRSEEDRAVDDALEVIGAERGDRGNVEGVVLRMIRAGYRKAAAADGDEQ